VFPTRLGGTNRAQQLLVNAQDRYGATVQESRVEVLPVNDPVRRIGAMTMKRLLAAVGMVFLLAASQSWANIIFTFSGATFSDGGTLTGTFTTDNTADSLVDYDILTAGGALPGFNYTPATAISLSSLPFIPGTRAGGWGSPSFK
jgi:hypothetical protein